MPAVTLPPDGAGGGGHAAASEGDGDGRPAADMSKSKSFFRRALSVRTVTLLKSSELAGSSRRSATSTTSTRSSTLAESIGKSQRNLSKAVGAAGKSVRRVAAGGGVKKLDREDVEVGKLLGKGGFNHVYEVKNVRRKSFLPDVGADVGGGGNDGAVGSAADDDPLLSLSASDSGRGGGNFVVKHLSPHVMDDEDRFRAAAVDLAHEAKLLSSIRHPNIVKLHGVTRGCIVSAFAAADDAGYFLLLDKLDCTLEERIREWREEEDAIKRTGQATMFFPGTRSLPHLPHASKKVGRLRRSALLRRLDVGRQVAAAISHLHSRNIIYRDLKPGNIGFDDAVGVVKIFDFGLSRELPPGDTEYRPTSMAGTPRYMAPEVARCDRYGLPADSYSFGLLLWEVCALEKPFRKLTARELQEKVAYGTKRPKVRSRWPEPVRDLMERCWEYNPAVRPGFDDIVSILEGEVGPREGEDSIDMSNHTV